MCLPLDEFLQEERFVWEHPFWSPFHVFDGPLFRFLMCQHSVPSRAAGNASRRATINADVSTERAELSLCDLCLQEERGVNRGRRIANAGATLTLFTLICGDFRI